MSCYLTEENAKLRKESIQGEVLYSSFMILKKGKSYHGVAKIDFECSCLENIFLDYAGKEITYLNINKDKINKDKFTNKLIDGHIDISEFLQVGSNTVIVQFKNDYSTDGNGLHSNIDCNGKQFIYCQNEPYNFNKVMPCFDQPDLKGRAAMSFLAPKDWQVISNTFEKSVIEADCFNQENILKEYLIENSDFIIENDNKETKFWQFNQTLTMSTYLFSFIAGDYAHVEKTEDNPLKVPIRIFYDRELQKYINKQQEYIYPFIIESILFYEQFFQTKCPWGKYDMIFCPEFTVGAMEFPGCVTYNDWLLFRTENPTANQVTRIGVIICHELAHMWFGNLTTMKWWNDLWLNESFADFMCFLCLHHISSKIPSNLTDAWTNMLNEKAWGYEEDSRLTTHPIACHVPNTSMADSIFDGITYSKGAAVIKQLYFILGHELFGNALKMYFEKYSFSNATLFDFLSMMQSASKSVFDMESFNKEWIETAGLNVLRTEIDFNKQGQQALTIIQSSYLKEFPQLRNHKVKIAFFDEDGKIQEIQTVSIKNENQTQILFENKNFKGVIINYEDWGFMKTRFDFSSLALFQSKFKNINDSLTQLLILKTLYEMVEDGEYLATEFLEFLLKNELISFYISNPIMLQTILDYCLNSIEFMPCVYQKEFKGLIFEQILKASLQINQKSLENILIEKLIQFGTEDSQIVNLKNILDQEKGIKLFDLTEVQKWRIVFRIVGSQQFSSQIKEQYVNYLKKLIQSETSIEWQLATNALSSDKDCIGKIWQQIIDPKRELSYYKLSYVLIGFWSSIKVTYSKDKYIQQFFDIMPAVMNSEPKEIGREFLDNIPHFVSISKQIEQLRLIRAKVKEDLSYHINNIDKKIHDLERLRMIKSKYSI